MSGNKSNVWERQSGCWRSKLNGVGKMALKFYNWVNLSMLVGNF
jgi:hypothetical protein